MQANDKLRKEFSKARAARFRGARPRRALSELLLLACFVSFLAGWQYSATAAPAEAAPSPPKAVPTILVFGDSLSAGYGIDPEQGWVKLLARQLTAQGYEYRVVNASVSGETTGGGQSRLPRALQLHRPEIVVLELGANDGLRGLPAAQVRSHLESMISLSRQQGAKVLLLGMRVPPNYGPEYAASFHAVFDDLASKYALPFVPFFLEAVALDSTLIQNDNLHPNAAAQPKLLAGVWPALKPLLSGMKAEAKPRT